jgi:hypothetical protein
MTYSSWLNQVENWFAKIERDVIARGVFTSVKDMARKLMRYIRHYNRAPKPIKWTYRDPNHRITADTISDDVRCRGWRGLLRLRHQRLTADRVEFRCSPQAPSATVSVLVG